MLCSLLRTITWLIMEPPQVLCPFPKPLSHTIWAKVFPGLIKLTWKSQESCLLSTAFGLPKTPSNSTCFLMKPRLKVNGSYREVGEFHKLFCSEHLLLMSVAESSLLFLPTPTADVCGWKLIPVPFHRNFHHPTGNGSERDNIGSPELWSSTSHSCAHCHSLPLPSLLPCSYLPEHVQLPPKQ